MSTSQLAALAFRGIYLARVLRQRHPRTAVIETYPRAVLRELGQDQPSRRDPEGAAAALAAAEYALRAIGGQDGTIWKVAG